MPASVLILMATGFMPLTVPPHPPACFEHCSKEIIMAEPLISSPAPESESMTLEDLQEYLEAFPDSQREIETLVHSLAHDPHNVGKINALFRATHSVKSNAAMCQLYVLVDVIHPLED